MSKLYLQEKIDPAPGQYIIVGEDGFLTSGRLISEVNPQVVITIPSIYTSVTLSATCNGKVKTIAFDKLSDTKYNCYLPEFGFWQFVGINVDSNNVTTILEGDINVVAITTYQVTLEAN